jgi:hypothetical protein
VWIRRILCVLAAPVSSLRLHPNRNVIFALMVIVGLDTVTLIIKWITFAKECAK